MLKRTWAKINKTVSSPMWCYLSLIIVAFAMILVPLMFPGGNAVLTIVTNLGYGIFGSTFVAYLIDYGATVRKSANDQKEFFLLTKDLKETIENLISFRNRYNHLLPKADRMLPYEAWLKNIDRIPFEFDGHQSSLFAMNKTNFIFVLRMAKILESKSVLLVDNLSLPNDFLFNLGELVKNLNSALEDEERFNDFAFRLQISDVLKGIALLFPEYKHLLFEEWDCATELVRDSDLKG